MMLEKQAAANVVALIKAYLAVEDVPERRLSMDIYGHNQFIRKLRSGAKTSMTTRKYDEIVTYFAKRWPLGAVWPVGVPQPDGGLKIAAVKNPLVNGKRRPQIRRKKALRKAA